MKDYRVFEVTSDDNYKVKGKISFRLDDEEKQIFPKLKELGIKLSMKKNKLLWWDDDFVEIINKKTDKSIGFMEICY